MTDNKPPESQEKNISNNQNQTNKDNQANNQNQNNDQNPSNNQNNNVENNNINNNNNNNDIKNNNYINNNDNNNNIIKDNREIILSNKDISPFLIEFSLKENNEKLDELLCDLIKFKEELNNNYSERGFKQTLYHYLEKYLIELSFLMNDTVKKERLIKLYKWYKNKKGTFDDLKKITKKTYKEIYEIDELELQMQKEEEKKQLIEEDLSLNDEVEDIYKHRNKDVLYKEMLSEYKRKKINSKNMLIYKFQKMKKHSSVNETKKMKKTSSFLPLSYFKEKADSSTFYSTKFGNNTCSIKSNLINTPSSPFLDRVQGGSTEQSFFSMYNKSFFPKVNRETKYSYSFNRPPYEYFSIYLENKIINNKMKNAAEKRSAEEIKEKLDRFGYQKAKLNESILNKYELKDVINMYANTNNFESVLLKKYKSKNDKKPEKKEDEEKTTHVRLPVKHSTKVIIENDKNIEVNRSFKRSQSCVYMQVSHNLEEKQKMETEKVKNIDYNTKSIIEKNKEDIKVIKMKLKEPKMNIKSKILNYHIRNHHNKMPNDVVPDLFYKVGLYKQKFLNEKICDINDKKDVNAFNSFDSQNDSESEYHNFYISAYDISNLKKIESFKSHSTNKQNDDLNKTFHANRNNYLNFRKTMSFWKKRDYEYLSNQIIKNFDNTATNIKTNKGLQSHVHKGLLNKGNINIKIKKQNSLLKAMVNPIDESTYPQYFLPRTGSLLLRRTGDNFKIGKKKKKKK